MIAESLARRYSVAVFNLARDRNELDRVAEEFSMFYNILNDQDKFRYFLFSPRIGAIEKKKVLKSIFGDNLSHTMLHFLHLLLDKKRQTLILKMYGHFETLYNNLQKKAEITVRHAAELDQDTRSEIKRVFEKELQKSVTIIEKIDPSVVGGIQIRANNTVYDASIAYRLGKMKQLLLSK